MRTRVAGTEVTDTKRYSLNSILALTLLLSYFISLIITTINSLPFPASLRVENTRYHKS